LECREGLPAWNRSRKTTLRVFPFPMPTDVIKPHSHLKLRFSVPKNRVIEYEVEANRPVDTYILDEEGLREFYSRKDYIESYYGGFSNRLKHQQELKLPFGGWAYLVIKNAQNESVAVYYEIRT
jgi:hypothetical protein